MRNEFKLSFSKPKFIVDEKNSVVICELWFNVLQPSSFMPFTNNRMRVKAVSFCGKNDTFDVNIGKKVALAKAENKAYYSVSNKLTEMAKYIEKSFIEKVATFSDKSAKVIAHNEGYLKKF